LPDASYDLIYLDGDHRYPTVEQDCRHARRLVTPKGVICGDDLELVLTTPESVAAAKLDAHRDFMNGYHPGVSLAVHCVFGSVGMQDGFWWWPV
jgi:predicted O-methyltransferase YrrM